MPADTWLGTWTEITAVAGAHASSHEDGGGDELEVINLATAETDTALVLHPDGAGGVEWGADDIGGGGSGDGYVAGGTVVQQGDCGATNTSPRTITFGVAPTNGNVIYLLTQIVNSTVNLTPTQTGVTWTALDDYSATNRIVLWKGVVGSGAGTVLTITRASGTAFWHAWAIELSGTSGTLVSSAKFSAADSDVHVTEAINPGAGCVLFYGVGQVGGGANSVVAPRFIRGTGSSFNYGFLGYRLATAANDPIGGHGFQNGTGIWTAMIAAIT